MRSFFKYGVLASIFALAVYVFLTPVPGCATCRTAALVPGFYVATNGNDASPGTLSQPFATLTRAQTAMRASSISKTSFIRAGAYAPAIISACEGGADTCLLDVEAGSGDNGTTYQYYPPDGYNTASITGGSTGVGVGAVNCVNLHANNVTFNGLHLHHCQYSMVRVSGGSNTGMTIINSELDHQYIPLTTRVSGGAISCYGCANAVTSHNYIHDTNAMGITFAEANGVITNWIADSNFFQSICTGSADCGTLYLFDPPATSSGTQWINSYIRDGNTFATLGSSFGAALYADDCAGDILMNGNLLTGRNGSNTIMFHGGKNLRANNNLIDIGTLQQHLVTFQGLPSCADTTMSGDQVENNVFVGIGPGGGYPLLSGSPTSPPTITNNDYFSYGTSSTVNHFVFVLEENQDVATILNNPGSLPYFTSLKNTYGWASQYYADTHPSMGNYFMLTTGQIISNNDAFNPGAGGLNTDNIVRRINTAGKTWKEYCESRPSVGYTGNDVYPFIQHHCPLGYFSDVRGGGSTQLNRLVDTNQLATDIAANFLPTYSFIAPNQLNNAHDGSLQTADAWLQAHIKPLIDNTTLMADTVVVIVFDEATTGDATHGGGRVYWVAIGPSVKSAYTSNFSFYQHESSARLSLDRLGLPSNMGAAATAPSMSEFFTTGAAFSTTGSGGTDTNPSTQDPMLTCWQYLINAVSAVLSAPVSFIDICRNWGPPGFVIPQTGTPPTSPHTC